MDVPVYPGQNQREFFRLECHGPFYALVYVCNYISTFHFVASVSNKNDLLEMKIAFRKLTFSTSELN